MKKRLIFIVVCIAVLGLCIILAYNTKFSDNNQNLAGSIITEDTNGVSKIGHAIISEKGTINGKKGDSTGREVEIREWYDKGWNLCLRPKSISLAEKSAKACEECCANNNIGYGQADRNSAYESYKKSGKVSKIELSNVDDSSLMTLCAIAGGCTKLNYKGNAPTNSTMRKCFAATGEYEVITDKAYLTTDRYLKRGDILVREGVHTVMILSDGIR